MDSNIPVSDILRMAMVVSRKLQLSDFQKWVESELNGYPSNKPVPEYRIVHGDLKCFNPYNGWIPILELNGDTEYIEMLSKRQIGQPISGLEEVASDRKSGTLRISLPKRIEQNFMHMNDMPFQPAVLIGHNQVKQIIDAVRNKILEWSLKLEETGILGENMTFTSKEKADAASNPVINNINYNTTIHSTQTMLQQGTTDSLQKQSNVTVNALLRFN